MKKLIIFIISFNIMLANEECNSNELKKIHDKFYKGYEGLTTVDKKYI